jgi:V8-like Glu-specific endopeptidase
VGHQDLVHGPQSLLYIAAMLKLIVVIFTYSLHSLAAIYGVDNRADIHQTPRVRPLATSTAIAVPNNFLNLKPDGNYEMEEVEVLGGSSAANACMDERFALQPIIGNCTGFLIGKRHLLTAGHCILPNGIIDNAHHPFCDAFSFYFDFNLDANGKTHEKNIPPQNLYRCSKVIRAETIEVNGVQKNDFALLELDRDVDPRFIPLKTQARIPKINESVFTIGHPSGLPAKFSGASSVLKNNDEFHFEANLDTLGGNSGGPVFDKNHNVLGILISGHPIDYYMDPSGCYRVNKCNSTGSLCKENPHFPNQQLSNYIQYVGAALKYLPGN